MFSGSAKGPARRPTLMTSERLGVSPFIRSKVLAHYDTGGGAQVSATRNDANSYVREKRRALEDWQRLLARIVGAPYGLPAEGTYFGGLSVLSSSAPLVQRGSGNAFDASAIRAFGAHVAPLAASSLVR
jgi:hypothetical protein